MYLGAVKFSSVLYSTYIIFYLYYFGNLTEVGLYSSAISIISPIIMISSLRYIEAIAISANKIKLLKLISISSAVLYTLLSLMVLIILFFTRDESYLLLLLALIVVKYLELKVDILCAFIISKNEKITFFSLLRLAVLILNSIFLIKLNYGFSSLNIIILSILISNITILIIYKSNNEKSDNTKVIFTELYGFIKNNIKFGYTNLFLSINSNIPKYYMIFLNEFELLGAYTILYLISATSVNILQNPISHTIDKLQYFIQREIVLLHNILNLFTLIWIITIYFLIQNNIIFTQINKLFDYVILIIIIIIILSIFMLIRGTLISLSIARAINNTNYYVILSILISLIFCGVFIFIAGNKFIIINGLTYIIFSSFITSKFILNKISN